MMRQSHGGRIDPNNNDSNTHIDIDHCHEIDTVHCCSFIQELSGRSVSLEQTHFDLLTPLFFFFFFFLRCAGRHMTLRRQVSNRVGSSVTQSTTCTHKQQRTMDLKNGSGEEERRVTLFLV